jgi:uncharacterized repeat protein (TIGR03803 family)
LTLFEGILYGMANDGTYNRGVIFSIDTSGNNFKDLFDFNGTDGSYIGGGFIISGKKLYGMTGGGGTSGYGIIFSIDTSSANFTTLFNFNNINGGRPYGSLLLDTGALVGLTPNGGISKDGVIFSIDTNGNNYRELFNFNGSNGQYPEGTLSYVNGIWYGTTGYGGVNNDGVIFSFKDTNTVTSIQEYSTSTRKVSIYPNPTNGICTLILNHLYPIAGKMRVEVLNTLGQKIYSALIAYPFSIDLNYQPNGLYLCKVYTEEGNFVGQVKILLER